MSTSQNLLAWQNRLIEDFERVSGIDWRWENESSQFEVFPYGSFSGPHAVEEVGRDYVTYLHPNPGEAFPKTIGRRLGLVVARVISRNQTATDKAWVFLERIRMAFKHPEIIEAWTQIGMSLARTSQIRLVDAIGSNDRMESIATMDMTMNLLPDALVGEIDLGTLEHVEVSSQGLPKNMEPEVIPPLP